MFNPNYDFEVNSISFEMETFLKNIDKHTDDQKNDIIEDFLRELETTLKENKDYSTLV